jgi:hypothetical protein
MFVMDLLGTVLVFMGIAAFIVAVTRLLLSPACGSPINTKEA